MDRDGADVHKIAKANNHYVDFAEADSGSGNTFIAGQREIPSRHLARSHSQSQGRIKFT